MAMDFTRPGLGLVFEASFAAKCIFFLVAGDLSEGSFVRNGVVQFPNFE